MNGGVVNEKPTPQEIYEAELRAAKLLGKVERKARGALKARRWARRKARP